MKLKRAILILGFIGCGLSIGAAMSLFEQFKNISLEDLNMELNQSSYILDKEGILLDEIHGEEHRKLVSLNEISPHIVNSVIAIEDARFRNHKGVSFKGILRASKANIQAGDIKEGASTLTMQLVKNLKGNTLDRTWHNKILEMAYSIKLEQYLTKDEILELYLNVIYWGNNTYGIQAAAETYFGEAANNVEIHEAAALAAMIQNPSKLNIYSPNRDENYKKLKARQKEVLIKVAPLYTECSKDEQVYSECLNEWVDTQSKLPLAFTGKRTWQASKNGFITDLAIQEAIDILDDVESVEDIKIGGYKIYSTITKSHQDLAKQIVSGYEVKDQQIAIGAIDPKTNQVIISIGSFDYNKSSLNRTSNNAGLNGRQPGSSQKPYVYYQAFAQGYSPSSTIVDQSVYKLGRNIKPYTVRGASDKSDTLNNHLKWSKNGAAVNLGKKVGIKNVIATMKNLGITTKLDNVLSFPLGSNDVVLLEHANAYAAFANDGYQTTYTSILKIEDKHGNVIVDNRQRLQDKKLSSDGVDKLNEVLRRTATGGTATAANTIPGVMAKTGTTDSSADVWCMAYTPNISLGVWRGYDDYKRKLYGAYGGTYACPVAGNILRSLNNNNYIK